MDASRFDRLTRAVAAPASRRRLVRYLAVLSIVARPVSDVATARKRKKNRVKRNEFGCVNVGKFCKNDDQCCSGICEGKKGKRKCRNHDAGTGCQKGDNACVEDLLDCTTATGTTTETRCSTTTGNAPYCWRSGACVDCRTDADCQELCGPAAACIKCPDCSQTTDTACVGPSPGDC